MKPRVVWAGVRLAVGMLTVVRVGGGAVRVDRPVAGVAMAVAPAVGAVVGAGAAVVGWGVARASAGALLAAVGVVGTSAVLSRGLHLDGLADTADGLGSGRPGEDALRIMKASDIGPFGVFTLVLVLLAEVAALAQCFAHGYGPFAAAACAAGGRLALPWACRRGVPSARPDGLGALVAGSVGPTVTAAVLVLGIAALGAAAWLVRALGGPAPSWVRAVIAGMVGVAAAALLLARCVRRFGGITGDVLGAAVETATAAMLVVLATA